MDDKILLIDKPKGITSAKAVALVKRKLKAKVGHAGTLDPLATGLLIILVGKKTKEFPTFLKMDKTYEVEAILGITTDTFDAEGKVVERNLIEVSREELEKALGEFSGEVMQVPPSFSAKKVKGKEAYKLARQGTMVNLPAQKVRVYSLSLEKFRYPRFAFTCRVSSGFYIRSLVNDIGDKLGAGATVTKLRRTKIGSYDIGDAQKLDDLA